MNIRLDAKEIAEAVSDYLQKKGMHYDFVVVTLFTEKISGKQTWGADVQLKKNEKDNGN